MLRRPAGRQIEGSDYPRFLVIEEGKPGILI